MISPLRQPAEGLRRLGAVSLVVASVAGCGTGASPGSTGSGGAVAEAPAAADAGADLTFSADDSASASGTVTLEAGGTVSATAADGTTFELVVPPEAVAGDTEISMTPLTDVTGIGDGAVHAVQLEPEGLEFYELVRLTITPAEPIPLAEQLMFEAAGDGSDPGLALIDPTSEPIVLLLEHFSVGGVASASDEQRARFILKGAENAERRISNEVRRLLGEERMRQLLGDSDVEGTSDELLAEMERLSEEYQREVLDRRREAAMLSCRALKIYVTSVISYARDRQLRGVEGEAAVVAAEARAALAVQEVTARYEQCEQEAIAACQEAEDPKILIEFWLAMARQFDRPVGDGAAMKQRAEEICEPQGYQFEFSGEATGSAAGTPTSVTWHYWGLRCEGTQEWKIWAQHEVVGQGSQATPPVGGPDHIVATYDENGALIARDYSTYPGLLDPFPPESLGFGIVSLQFVPPDEPTELTATISLGNTTTTATATAPVEPADGTIAGCDPPE